MNRHGRPAGERFPLTESEAELITMQAEQGRLDLSDPDIRRAVSRAARVARKTRMWGGVRSRTVVRKSVLAGAGLILLWMAGLFVPVLMSAGR